jgi:hypothetical protein
LRPELCGDFAGDHFVDVAPDPVFSGLDRADDRVVAAVEVFGGVLILGRVAAAYLPARHAHSQVNPGVAEFDALFADVFVGGGDFDLIEMFAFLRHFSSPKRFSVASICRHLSMQQSYNERRAQDAAEKVMSAPALSNLAAKASQEKAPIAARCDSHHPTTAALQSAEVQFLSSPAKFSGGLCHRSCDAQCSLCCS